LAELLADPTRSVAALLTTVTEGYDRISMHGVRRTLLLQQADALGLPLNVVTIPQRATNAVYESAMEAAFDRFRAEESRPLRSAICFWPTCAATGKPGWPGWG